MGKRWFSYVLFCSASETQHQELRAFLKAYELEDYSAIYSFWALDLVDTGTDP